MSRVAVITRTKNRPLFLRRAINSVAEQTYGDYTHVIVNDAGDKRAVDKLVASLPGETRNKIKLFHRKKPSGAPDTIFNESIDRVDSTYVAIHDDDDTWHPKFLEKTVAALDAGAKGVVVRMDEVLEVLEKDRVKIKKTKPYLPKMREVNFDRQLLINQLTAGGFVYSRAAYEAVGGYEDSLPVAGDWEFGIRFLDKYPVEFLDPGYALAFYHRRTNAKDDSYAERDHREIIDQIIDLHLKKDQANGRPGLGQKLQVARKNYDRRRRLAKKLLPEPLKKLLRKLSSPF